MTPPRRPGHLLVCALGAAGAIHWWAFFAGGRFDMSMADWPRQVAYFEILASALRGGYLPLQLSAPAYDMGAAFFANLEAPLSPQTWLLSLAGPGVATMLSVIVMSWIGLYGCVRVTRRCGLSDVACVALVLLTGYNGYVVGHIGAGHLAWVGCYLLPFVFEGVLAMFSAGRAGSRAPIATAAVLAVMVLQGSLHIAVMTGMLLLLVAVTQAGMRGQIGVCLAWCAAFSAFRLVPAAAGFWHGGRPWLADGFGSVSQVLEGLLLVQPPSAVVATGTTLLYGVRDVVLLRRFEFDLYVGVVGGLGLLLFVLVPMVRRTAPSGGGPDAALRALHLPLAVLTALSCWRLYATVIPAPVSLLSVERVPSRLLGIVLMLAVMMACLRADVWWRAAPRRVMDSALIVGALVVLALQLAYHSVVVSPARAGAYLASLEPTPVSVGGDPAGVYVAALIVGAVITVISAVLAARRLRRPAAGAV